MRLVVVNYQQRRLEHFKKQLAAAKRRLKWSIDHNRNWMELEDNGEIVSYYEWAVQMAEKDVVFCKDCKHYRNYPNGLCYLHTEPKSNARGYSGEAVCVEPDGFCSYGERKDEADAKG